MKTDLDDASPEVQAWDEERQRLQLVAACALRQLFTHMGPVEAIYLPEGTEILEVRKVKQETAHG